MRSSVRFAHKVSSVFGVKSRMRLVFPPPAALRRICTVSQKPSVDTTSRMPGSNSVKNAVSVSILSDRLSRKGFRGSLMSPPCAAALGGTTHVPRDHRMTIREQSHCWAYCGGGLQEAHSRRNRIGRRERRPFQYGGQKYCDRNTC